MSVMIAVALFLIATLYLVPAWQAASHTVSSTLSVVGATEEEMSSREIVNVSIGESVKIEGTDVMLTNESVATRELSQPFDTLYIVTLQTSLGDKSETLKLIRSQPAGYADQPTIVWNGYRFTLLKAKPLGAQSATVQVQAQV